MSESERARLPLDDLKPIKGLEGDEDTPKLQARLTERGYKEREVDKIMGKNFMRVFREIL